MPCFIIEFVSGASCCTLIGQALVGESWKVLKIKKIWKNSKALLEQPQSKGCKIQLKKYPNDI